MFIKEYWLSGFAGQELIVASGGRGGCDGAHWMIVMKEFQWLPGWAPMLPTHGTPRFDFGRCPADNHDFSLWQPQRRPLLEKREKWRTRLQRESSTSCRTSITA
jgi:hypothetical protein